MSDCRCETGLGFVCAKFSELTQRGHMTHEKKYPSLTCLAFSLGKMTTDILSPEVR